MEENMQEGQVVNGYNRVRTFEDVMNEEKNSAEDSSLLGDVKKFVNKSSAVSHKVQNTVNKTYRTLSQASEGLDMMSKMFGEDTSLGKLFGDMSKSMNEAHDKLYDTLHGEEAKTATIDEDYVNSIEDDEPVTTDETVDTTDVKSSDTSSKKNDGNIVVKTPEEQAEIVKKGSQKPYNKDLGYTEEQLISAKAHGTPTESINSAFANGLVKDNEGYILPFKASKLSKPAIDVNMLNNPQIAAMSAVKYATAPFVRKGKTLPDNTMARDMSFHDIERETDVNKFLVKNDSQLLQNFGADMDLSIMMNSNGITDQREGDVEDTAVANHTDTKSEIDVANSRYQKSLEALNMDAIERNQQADMFKDAFSLSV